MRKAFAKNMQMEREENRSNAEMHPSSSFHSPVSSRAPYSGERNAAPCRWRTGAQLCCSNGSNNAGRTQSFEEGERDHFFSLGLPLIVIGGLHYIRMLNYIVVLVLPVNIEIHLIVNVKLHY